MGSGPGDSSGSEDAGPRVGRLRAGFLWWAGGIVERWGRSRERRVETKKKKEDLPYLPNKLAEPLDESI